MLQTAATGEMQRLINVYKSVFPLWSFPFLPLAIAAFFQSLAWLSGPILFHNFSLWPRLLILWLMAGGEYLFMSPAMNASVEILGMKEPALVVIYQIITLIVFMLVNMFVFKKPFAMKYFISFILISMAFYIAYLW